MCAPRGLGGSWVLRDGRAETRFVDVVAVGVRGQELDDPLGLFIGERTFVVVGVVGLHAFDGEVPRLLRPLGEVILIGRVAARAVVENEIPIVLLVGFVVGNDRSQCEHRKREM